MRDVSKPQRLLDLSESIFAEGSVLDVFELVAHFVKLAFREGVLPRGKDDRVLASRVVLIHQDERLERTGKRFGIARADRAFAGHRQDIIGDLAAPIMLGLEYIDIRRRRSAGPFYDGEDMSLFELSLVVVLAKAAKQLYRPGDRFER